MDDNFQLKCFLNYGPTKKSLALASTFPHTSTFVLKPQQHRDMPSSLEDVHGNLELTHRVGQQSSTKAQLDSSCQYSRPGAL